MLHFNHESDEKRVCLCVCVCEREGERGRERERERENLAEDDENVCDACLCGILRVIECVGLY